MHVAFVDQPFSPLVTPPNNSVAIWLYEVSRRLATATSVTVYGLRGLQPSVETQAAVTLRRFNLARDYVGLGALYGLIQRVVGATVESPVYGLDYALQVARDLRARRCDVVHLPNFIQFAPIIRRFNPHIKIVLHMHCEWLTQRDEADIARQLRAVDIIFGCSDYITHKIQARFPQWADRCHTVFNGVDHTEFAAPDAGRPEDTSRLLFVGRVSPEKGVHVLLDAFVRIARVRPEATLHIVGHRQPLPPELLMSLSDEPAVRALAAFYANGQADYEAHLRAQLRAAGLEQRVTFSGALPHAEVSQQYRAADVVLNPSLYESFGMSVIEAMASEVPVVVSAVGGMPAIIAGSGAGECVPPNDAPRLAEAALALLADPACRRAMGQAGRRRVLVNFTWEAVAATALRHFRAVRDE